MTGYLVCSLVGLIVGYIICLVITAAKTTLGTLFIGENAEGIDVYNIEIENLDIIPKKNMVVLKVSKTHK